MKKTTTWLLSIFTVLLMFSTGAVAAQSMMATSGTHVDDHMSSRAEGYLEALRYSPMHPVKEEDKQVVDLSGIEEEHNETDLTDDDFAHIEAVDQAPDQGPVEVVPVKEEHLSSRGEGYLEALTYKPGERDDGRPVQLFERINRPDIIFVD